MYVGTAIGDAEHFTARMTEAARVAGLDLTPLHLFPMPNIEDIEDIEDGVLDQDVVWVMGGSVANLLAVWRVHGLDRVMRRAWEAGVVLSGVSAGSICWFPGGATASFGPALQPLTNALGPTRKVVQLTDSRVETDAERGVVVLSPSQYGSPWSDPSRVAMVAPRRRARGPVA